MIRYPILHAALLLALAAPAAVTAAPASTNAFDPAQAWQQFLDKGEFDPAMAAFDLMGSVGYDGDQVDGAACAQHRDAVTKAVDAAPVSIAIRRIAFMCAQATGDDAAAEREMTVVAALSRHALGQAGDPDTSKPIRVLGAADATALVLASGMRVQSVAYALGQPQRYFPIEIVGWNADAKVERHLTFDFIDTMYQIVRSDPNKGFPVLRRGLVSSMLGGEGRDLSARDINAVRQAHEAEGQAAQLAGLRPLAREGGLRAAFEWAQLCGAQPTTVCGEGFVDAVLPRAERQQALSMLLLAYAHLQGLGVARDEAAAWALLDAADRRWPNYGATAEFTRLWLRVHEDPIPDEAVPAALQKRLDRAAAEGNRFARRLALRRKIFLPTKPKLEERDLAFLAEPAENGNGAGFALLADYHDRQAQPQLRLQALEQSALAGTTTAQALYAWELMYGTGARDSVRGEQFVRLAADGGNAWAARYESDKLARDSQWPSAEKWLLPPASDGNGDALVELAQIWSDEHPGVVGTAKEAVEIYRSLLDGELDGRARIGLAEMAMSGRGMKKDPQQALRWLLPVAEKGDLDAQTRVGLGYLYGDFGKTSEAQGVKWLQAPLAQKQGWAAMAYGNWLYHRKKTPQSRTQAVGLWEQATSNGYVPAYNELAWASCTSPFPESYNPARGMQAVAKLNESGELTPAELDTVAACHAAAGDFKHAIEVQSLAIEQVDARVASDPERYKEMAEGFRERLALYRSDRRYVQADKKTL